MWAGARFAARTEHAAAWLGLWDRYGTLWSQATLTRIEGDIRTNVGEEMGGWDDRPALPVEMVEAEDGTGADHRNDCDGPDEITLSEIGADLGVCRERARCIILQALAAFAKAWAKANPRDPLPWLLYDENNRRPPPIVRMVQIDAAIAAAQKAAA